MIDDSQNITVRDTSIIWVSLYIDSDQLVNLPNLPIKAVGGIFDTQDQYKSISVSYGVEGSSSWGKIVVRDGANVQFTQNRDYNTIRQINIRNFVYCKYLNLQYAINVTELDLLYLENLIVLIIWGSGIRVIDLVSLKKLELVICGSYGGNPNNA